MNIVGSKLQQICYLVEIELAEIVIVIKTQIPCDYYICERSIRSCKQKSSHKFNNKLNNEIYSCVILVEYIKI